MRAKMLALDLSGRMPAERDAELRHSVREVNTEWRFLEWLADATACFEAAADAERAEAFRDRVAQAVSWAFGSEANAADCARPAS